MFGGTMRIGPPAGETDSDRLKTRQSRKYKLFRDSIAERDEQACVCCGDVVDYDANVHHIRSFYSFPDLRFDPKNCITLCERCHAVIHGKPYKGKLKRPDPNSYVDGYSEGYDAGIRHAVSKFFKYLLSIKKTA